MIRINKKLRGKLRSKSGQPQLSLNNSRGSWDSPNFLPKLKGKLGQPLLSSIILEEARTVPILSRNLFFCKFKGKSGQNMIEYMLLFVCVVLVIFVALAPRGFLSVKINNSLDLAVQGIEGMANSVNDSY